MKPTAAAGTVVPIAVLAIFLTRAVTLGMNTHAEPVVQSASNLVVTLAVIVLGLAGPGWRRNLRLASPPLKAGAVLYAVAAMLGGAVALPRHNESRLLAGQLLSMGLLPLAALGGWMSRAASAARRFAGTVAAASCAFCLAALAFGFARLAAGHDPRRFSFPGGGLPTATVIAAMVFGVALGVTATGRARRIWLALAGVVAAFALASSVRSLWVACALALAAFAALAWGAGAPRLRRVLRTAAAVVAIAGCGAILAALWWGRSRPNLVAPNERGARTTGTVTAPDVPRGGYRLRGEVVFKAAGRGRSEVLPAGRMPSAGPMTEFTVLGAGPGAARFSEEVVNGGGTTSFEIRLQDAQGVADALGSVALERLGPAWVGAIAFAVDRSVRRPVDPAAAAAGEAFSGDASLAFRFRESKAALDGFSRSSWPTRLFGHGLGARLELSALGYNGRGDVVKFENPNYIHNFYLFLLFKLGIVGLAAVVTALLLWIVVPALAALRFPRGHPSRVLLAAVAAVWFGYAIWSLAAPEILDFRVAPLWGFLLAATPLGPDEGGAQTGDAP